MRTALAMLALLLLTDVAAAQGYPGPQGGFYVYGPDHEYHLLAAISRSWCCGRNAIHNGIPIAMCCQHLDIHFSR